MILRVALSILLPRLAPTWVGLLFALVQVDAMVDWGATRQRALALPAGLRGSAVALTLAAWLLACRRPLRRAILGPELGFARRSGLSNRAWAAQVAAVAAVAAAPWTAVWALCGGWPEAAGSLGLAIVGGAATLSRRPLPITALALGAVGALPLAGHAAALGAFSVAALPAIWDDRGDLPPNAPPGAAPWPASPWAALVARDLIGAWRTAPASVRTSVSTGLLLGACAFAVRRNGDPRQATTAVLCLSLAALPAATSLMQAAVRSRGGQADDPRLPFTSLERALSLSAVAAVGWAPAGLAVVLLGPGPAAPRAALTLLMGAAVAALAVPASLERARPRAEPGGPTLWVMLGLLTLILLPAAWAIPGLLGAAALGLTAGTVGLARARDARR